jgi:hypothetical protein
VTRQRIGRRNQYQVHLDLPFRHPQQSGLRVGPFLDLLTGGLLLQEAGALSAVSVARTDAQHGLFGIGSAPLTVISSAEPPTSQ